MHFWFRARRALRGSRRTGLFIGNGETLPDGHPAAGKGPVDDKPAAYVCRGPVCGLPVTDPRALAGAISGNAA